MRKSLVALATGVLLTTACSKNEPQDQWAEYKNIAQSVLSQSKDAKFDSIALGSQKLVAQAKIVLGLFLPRHPECKEYINAVLAAADLMQTLDLDAIEADYHADGKLPAMKNASCYHAKDLLVHPATVTVMAKTEQDSPLTRKQMAHEIEEVLMHFEQVAEASSKN
ncbi:hypothetical protein C2869_07455 [Saccharobesus litoralis]|uniref:Uncharacterized protein n=1 Tax=Saccharobesus litoralis TaxID=2172099 RepID=A0A2S0VPZ1_9ALTE|nr:hypothetical protein [Saccharobesus litoralis]AWB66276.1 hypothetical protein C2869_07455 [Saccharobesus litoralis]